MNNYFELLPVLSGLIVGAISTLRLRRSFSLMLCLAAGLAVNRLSGEGWQGLPADLATVTAMSLAVTVLLRRWKIAG